MKKIVFVILVVIVLVVVIKTMKTHSPNIGKPEGNNLPEEVVTPQITPISHASMILAWGGKNIYIDPVDEKKAGVYAGKPEADIILITDIHGDHFDPEALKAITKDKTTILAPQAVFDMTPEELKAKVFVMKNDDILDEGGWKVRAIPMYNLPGPSEQYHAKGRGNGYIIEHNNIRIYVAGDTAGIPEMRNLKDIDIAFVPMNLPYTMSPEEAAEAVLAFKPKKVYPYHYRQNPTKDFANVAKFKEIVNSKDPGIEVIQLNWYP